MSWIVITIFALQTAAGQTPKPAWKGTITNENGVKVVHNPAEPLYGTFAFDLQEDLKIGGDPNNAPSYFPKGGALTVDDAGHIFVADFGNSRVQMFDESGKFVRTIGRKGQGPGEYSFPIRISFDAEGHPYVWDGGNALVFGPDGAFIRKIAPQVGLSQEILGAGGSIIGTTQIRLGPGEPKHTLVVLTPDGALSRTIAEFHGELREGQKSLALHWYTNRIVLSPLSPGSFLYGFSDEYKIFRCDAAGRSTLVVSLDAAPQTISAAEKAETRKSGVYAWWNAPGNHGDAAVFPDHRPFFSGFLSDEAGRIYVLKAGSILEKDAPTPVDVFSQDGIFLYRMAWKTAPATLKNGAYFEVREDKETGEYTIVRSKIKNWAALKSGF